MFMSIYDHQVTCDGEELISASLGPCCLVYRAQDVDEWSLMVPVQISQDCSTFGDPSQIWLTTSLASFIESYLLTPQSSQSDCQHILEWVTIWSPIVTTLQLAIPVSNIFTNTLQIH
jgi:hypothetical protein